MRYHQRSSTKQWCSGDGASAKSTYHHNGSGMRAHTGRALPMPGNLFYVVTDECNLEGLKVIMDAGMVLLSDLLMIDD